MNRRLRDTILFRAVLLMCAMTVAGCAKKAPAVAEHQAAPHTGPHGGALVTLSPEAVRSAGIAIANCTAVPARTPIA